MQDFQHVFGGQRLEIEPVGGVIVGRNRFRIAVDHDRLIARLRQREAGVDAAIIELDPLPDPVRSAAQDDDLLAVARLRLAFGLAKAGGFVGRIHIGRFRLEFGGAGVDALEHRADAQFVAQLAHFVLGRRRRSSRAAHRGSGQSRGASAVRHARPDMRPIRTARIASRLSEKPMAFRRRSACGIAAAGHLP